MRLRRGGERPARHYRVVPALARAIGSLVAWRGITARLARENSIRQPGRTLTTAAALTVGLALVTLVAVLADGTKATIDQAVSRSFAGNLIVENSQAGNEAGHPGAGGARAPACPGSGDRDTDRVHRRAPARAQRQRLDHRDRPSTFGRVYRVEWKQGSNATLPALEDTGTILTKDYAEARTN